MEIKKVVYIAITLLLLITCKQSQKKESNYEIRENNTKILKAEILNVSNFDSFNKDDLLQLKLKYIPHNIDCSIVKINNAKLSNYQINNNILSFKLSENVKAGNNSIEVKITKKDSTFVANLNIIVKNNKPPVKYTYKIVRSYPHDQSSYTQGLEFYDGYMYEGSGQYGFSSLRKYKLENNEVILSRNLPSDVFGEGIVIYKDKIYQLTWQSHIVYEYNLNDFSLIRTFENPTEGWGLTKYNDMLVMSDGSNTLYFLNPDNFNEIKRIEVFDNNSPVNNLNELEYIPPYIYANVYQTDKIVMINPETGFVEGEIDLRNILNKKKCTREPDVLNGIAYDFKNNRLFVTGKYWPEIYQIELIKKQ
ncbi:MAG: glutaminyl-peptide cyclotransferase [Bacteroidales bacterium]|nr:glutaminyl-peptide cyclotransferase [Bacteroidales bacterium]